jgi:S-methylmethionine-dependent homocysteine/selenocysteine methylase
VSIRLLRPGPVLADGGIETAIVYDKRFPLPELQTIGMVADRDGRRVLKELWSDYLSVGARHGLPMVIGTPTWRGGRDRIVAAGLGEGDLEDLNRTGVDFQRQLVADLDLEGSTVVAGVIAPRGDGYRPDHALDVGAAAAYHAGQAQVLAEAGADFLFGVPLPAADEAIGMCRAMAATGTPYVPSFLLDARGALADGTALPEVLGRLSSEVRPPPLHVSLSCVHPTTVLEAASRLGTEGFRGPSPSVVVAELKANGSALPPSVLDAADHLECDPPQVWAAAMAEAGERLGLRVLGGCCGTNPASLEALAERLTAPR